MKTVMMMKWDGVTADDYEKIRKLANWEEQVPKGAVFHVAAFDNNVCRVTDIWESVEDFNNFVQNRLMPAVAKLGIKGEPQIELLPVHAIFVPVLESLSV